jgi:hypothetical protein
MDNQATISTEYHIMLLTGVVTTGKVVGSILLAADELLRVEELAVSASPHLIDHSGLKVNKHSTGDVLPSTSLTEEGVESIITSSNGLVTGHLAISLNAMLEAVEFPARVSDLDTGLADVDRDALPHGVVGRMGRRRRWGMGEGGKL